MREGNLTCSSTCFCYFLPSSNVREDESLIDQSHIMAYMILRIYLLACSSAKFYMISFSIYTSFHIENIVMIVSAQDLDD